MTLRRQIPGWILGQGNVLRRALLGQWVKFAPAVRQRRALRPRRRPRRDHCAGRCRITSLLKTLSTTNSQVVDANKSIPLEWGARGGQGRRHDSANVADGSRLVMREGHVGASYQL